VEQGFSEYGRATIINAEIFLFHGRSSLLHNRPLPDISRGRKGTNKPKIERL